jgi:hypothetical protein
MMIFIETSDECLRGPERETVAKSLSNASLPNTIYPGSPFPFSRSLLPLD